jgi:hypothetical protein
LLISPTPNVLGQTEYGFNGSGALEGAVCVPAFSSFANLALGSTYISTTGSDCLQDPLMEQGFMWAPSSSPLSSTAVCNNQEPPLPLSLSLSENLGIIWSYLNTEGKVYGVFIA